MMISKFTSSAVLVALRGTKPNLLHAAAKAKLAENMVTYVITFLRKTMNSNAKIEVID